MSPLIEPDAVVDRLIARITEPRAAAYLLGSDREDANRALGTLGSVPPIERCLRHAEASHSIDSFALLQLSPVQVLPFVERLQALHRQHPRQLFNLAAIWALRFTDVGTRLHLADTITPSSWIEQQELAAVRDGTRVFGRPPWFRPRHPAFTRVQLGGAWSRRILLADLYDVCSTACAGSLSDRWILYGDIDGMKHYNDQRGALEGDRVITAVIETIQATVGDRVLRYGGDEVIVFVAGDDGPDVAELLRKRIEAAALGVTMSFGVVRTGETPKTIDAATNAMFAAKGRGRNRVVVG